MRMGVGRFRWRKWERRRRCYEAGGKEMVERWEETETEEGELGLFVRDAREDGRGGSAKAIGGIGKELGHAGRRSNRLTEKAEAISDFFCSWFGGVEKGKGSAQGSGVSGGEGVVVQRGSAGKRGDDGSFVAAEKETVGRTKFKERSDEWDEISIRKDAV